MDKYVCNMDKYILQIYFARLPDNHPPLFFTLKSGDEDLKMICFGFGVFF